QPASCVCALTPDERRRSASSSPSARGLPSPRGRARNPFKVVRRVGWAKARLRRAHLHKHSQNGGHASLCPPYRVLSRNPMLLYFAPLALSLIGLALFGHGGYIHAKAILAQVLLERAFTDSIATHHPVKPWSWVDTWPVARIEVKRLNARAIV